MAKFWKIWFLSILWSSVYGFSHEHKDWDKLLKKYVTPDRGISVVKYLDWKKDESSIKLFDAYLLELSEVKENEFSNFLPNDQLAFLINAYNAFTVKLILDHYPVKSIKDLGSLFSSPWKKEFFKFFQKDLSLDEIEHKKIREKFNEPRIHFAVVCASKSCPPLRNEAYLGKNLEKQLEDQTLLFINDERRNKYDSNSKTLTLSKIFDWYGKDFEKKFGSVNLFFSDKMKINEIAGKNIKIKYFDYDWSLNE